MSDKPTLASLIQKVPKADAMQVGGDHYKSMAMQPWEAIEAVLTPIEFIGFLKGNVLKYAIRDGKKPGALDDGAKAIHYKQKLYEVLGR